MYGFGLGHPRLNPEGTFKVFCKADEGLCLAVRGGALVLATADPTDEHQHWFKDVRFCLRIKDEEGKPVFSLVNKATGFAIQHSLGPGHPVRLVKFNPEDFEESVLWTESGHLGRDFGRIRMLYDVDLCLDALPCNEDGGGVRDGTVITLTERAEGDTQSWKILYWSDEADETCGGLYNLPTCRIYCKANMGFSLTVRNGTVCLAPTDINDKYQEWIEDTRLGDMIKDHEGYPAFALINYATGHAIHASTGHGNHVLELKPYNPTYVDEFRLWTKSRDMGEGFRCIHMLGNISLNFDAFQVDRDHGGVRDDTKLMLSYWTEENNLQLQWRITPWCKSPYSTHFTTIAGCPEQCKSPYESTFH